MSSDHEVPQGLIWATRGRSWGFRFLLDGGMPDPLLEYERVLAGLGDEPRAWRRVAGKVALRFPDPEGRRDAAGRLIPHGFVIAGDLANEVQSVEAGLQQVWPLVEDAYARVWDADGPPSATDLRFSVHDDISTGAPRSTSGYGRDD